jgi:hypothetical protein
MDIMLGNLTIKEFSERSGVIFSDEDERFLSKHRVEHASIITKDKFHIFDIPFSILCGSQEFAQKLYDVIKKYDFSGSPQLRINVLKAEETPPPPFSL